LPRKKKDYGFRPEEKVPGPDNRHLRITMSMMESQAWKQLSVHAMVLYLHIKAKYTGHNMDDISFTYAEGEELMNKLTFTKALDQLIDYGFIRVIRQSWTSREPNIYGLHSMWQHFGTDKFSVQPRRKRDAPKIKG
jgi:hypothetical protein